MSLVDLGLDVPASSGNQNQTTQQQQQTENPFGDFQNVAQQQSQQQQQLNNVDPFGIPQPSSENLANKPPQQPDGFDAAFSDTPTPANTPQGGLQSHDVNSGVLEQSKDSTPAQQEASPKDETPSEPSADPGTGNVAEQPTDGTERDVNEATDTSSGGVKERLKEIEKLFGGRWRLLRSDPYGEYLKAIGVGMLTRNRASGGTPDIQISVLHEYIFINTSSMLHSQITKVKLDESVENVVFKANQSVFCTYQNQMIELQMTPVDVAWSKTQGVEYSINDRGELMVVFASGSNVCRRYFAKVIQVTK